MGDLEHWLLEAAGRTGTSGRKNLSHPKGRRQRGGSYSDDGSDSGDDDSDNQEGTTKGRTQVPIKKRFDPPEKDGRNNAAADEEEEEEEEDGSDDERRGSYDSDSELSVGSDLYKDDEDREKLSKMSELEREMILADRSTRRDDYWLKKKARESSRNSERKERKVTPPPPPRFGRTAATSDRAAAKNALNELRARRLKQQDADGLRRPRGDAGGVVAAAGPTVADPSPGKRKRFAGAPVPEDDSSSSESEDRRPARNQAPARDDSPAESDDDGSIGGDGLAFEDVRAITIRRSKLAKWFMEPFFEDLIAGCFVRVGIGVSRSGQRVYRLCMVKNVDASDPDRTYQLENKTTHKYLNVVWGSEAAAARWEMARISDAPPTEEEFRAMLHEVERAGGRPPTQEDVQEKVEEIRKINTFVYSAATVKQMLQEKKSAAVRPLNVAAEKNRLRKEIEVAEMRGDEAELERARSRLGELEAMSRHAKKDDKAARLAEMNRKNRVENFKNASDLKPVNFGLKAGDAGYDPFSRRWTRSSNYYMSKPGAAAAANGDGPTSKAEDNTAGTEAGEKATAAALEAAAGAGKLVDTNAPVDRGTESNLLHSFELPISLAALQSFGGPQGVYAGFMARKRRIEATIGYKVPENDGRRHALTLTIGDYKRRRGLL